MKYLVLRLESYFMSYGEGDYWDVRGTGAFPTKSSILGILSACKGLDWTNEQHAQEIVAIGESLSLSVREDSKCMIQRDYHTILDTLKADGKLNPNAVQSYRNYLMDGSFTALLSFSHFNLYETVKSSLLNPVWPIFLGRKACAPTLPIYWNEEIEGENSKSIFEKLETIPQTKQRILSIRPKRNPWTQGKIEKQQLPCITEENLEIDSKKSLIRDAVVNPTLRVFSQREVYKFYVEGPNDVSIST
ncbi:type I-E CRISPR-associated protein Cas5/CasD [Leptospira kirschneri]|uniref:CRISPR-associated protein Cas5/CasD, subtype TIGR01868 n=1 Tax=Leptospira kirschneri serovar Bulgarica str. Nikolaevo TaxID=1240687 RepID=M6FRY0_9LEPT|nr:type I-E CRISPR-associated protein Cas5/CasD [Leptospira kirschneri]EMK25491.1 CRISPR-associated protein Cas5/CasD, subtype TIGR01868 [Leptospira kirschneri serovar Bulgarica str. Nikolaevo]